MDTSARTWENQGKRGNSTGASIVYAPLGRRGGRREGRRRGGRRRGGREEKWREEKEGGEGEEKGRRRTGTHTHTHTLPYTTLTSEIFSVAPRGTYIHTHL